MEMNYQGEVTIQVGRLEQIGISSEKVVGLYKSKGISLNFNELIKVSPKDEGKNINFETWDKISILVPVYQSSGGFNKVE